jgi:hypothetical protein
MTVEKDGEEAEKSAVELSDRTSATAAAARAERLEQREKPGGRAAIARS